MMKIKLIIALIALCTFNLKAQDYKAAIKKTFSDYALLFQKGEYEKTLDYIHPALFEIVPKDQMAGMFRQLLNSKDIAFKFLSFNVDTIYTPKTVEDKQYCLLYYTNKIEMKFNALDTLKDDKLKSTVDVMTTSFANKYGSERVQYDANNKSFLINAKKKSIAISPVGKADWKIINVEPEQKMMMEKILPKEIREEAY